MKASQFYLSVAIGGVCLILSIALIALGQSNQRLQTQIQHQQEEINRGQTSSQVLQNLLRDLAEASVKNDKIKQVLARNGYTVSARPPASPSPSPAQ